VIAALLDAVNAVWGRQPVVELKRRK